MVNGRQWSMVTQRQLAEIDHPDDFGRSGNCAETVRPAVLGWLLLIGH
jgi:hypothetical protein